MSDNLDNSIVAYGDQITASKPRIRSIQDFRSSFTTDLGRPAHFDVVLTVPPLFTSSEFGAGIASTERLTFRCESAQIPGREIATQDLKIYGPVEKLPYHSNYGDATFTFICSSSMIEKNLFDLWMDYINPPETWNFRFKNNYITNILVNQYDSTKENTYQVTLIDAFPIGMSQLDLNWADDGYHRLSITFAYTYWAHTSPYKAEQVSSAIDINSPFYIANLKKIIEAGALAKSVFFNNGSSNPYGMVAAAGAAASIFSGDWTLSKTLNNIGVQDSYVDSRVFAPNNPITPSQADVSDMNQDK